MVSSRSCSCSNARDSSTIGIRVRCARPTSPGIGRHPINTATNRPGKAIKVGGSASLIAITPNGTTAYLVVGNSLVPINTANNQVGRAIKAGTQPVAIAFTPRRSGSRARCQPPLRLISRFEHPGLLASADLG